MLRAIEKMKIFLQMGFRESTSFTGGGISIKTQGLCQGNRAAPAGWAVSSICILRLHGKKRHGAKLLCLNSKLKQHLSATLYVKDTDLLHINLMKDDRMDNIHTATHESINRWGNLLIATGGVL
jgi:hypothetical protein